MLPSPRLRSFLAGRHSFSIAEHVGPTRNSLATWASRLIAITWVLSLSHAPAQNFGPLLNPPAVNAPTQDSSQRTENQREKPPTSSNQDDAREDSAPPTKQDSSPSETASKAALFKSLRSRVGESKLSDDEKKATLQIIDQGESQLAELQTKTKLIQERAAALAIVPQRSKQLSQTLDELTKFKPEIPKEDSLATLEIQLAKSEAELTAAKKSVLETESAMTRTSQRHREIEEELPTLQEKLAELKTPTQNDLSSEASLQDQAEQAESQVAARLTQLRIESLNAETALLDAELAANLPQLRRDVAVRRADNLQRQKEAVEAVVEKLRAVEAAKRVESANEQLRQLHPALQPIGEKNKELAESSQELAVKIEQIQKLMTQRSATLEQLEGSLKQAKAAVETVGLTDAVGAMLRNLKQGLPASNEYLLNTADRQSEINDIQFELFELTDLRNKKLSQMAVKLLRETKAPVSVEEKSTLAAKAEELLQQQRTDFLDPAIRTKNNYFNALVSLSTTEHQIIKTVQTIRLYVDERVLWVRSTQPLTSQLAPSNEESWFLQTSSWDGTLPRLASDFKRRLFLWCVSILALICLVRFRASLRSEIAELGEQVSQAGYTRFLPTIKTLMLTVFTAAPLFFTFAFLSWRLDAIAGGNGPINALSNACFTFALGYFPAEIVRQICRPKGLAESHFGLPPKQVAMVRRGMRLTLFIVLPLITATAFLNSSGLVIGRDTLARYTFVAGMAALAWILMRLFSPHQGAFAQYIRKHPDAWVSRLTFVWFPLLIALPVALAILAIVGYYFTSQQLGWRLYRSAGAMSILALVSFLILRWAMLRRRQLKIDELRERRAAAAEAAAPETPVEAFDLSSIDLSSQVQQTKQVLQTTMIVAGLAWLWLVWKDVFPALGLLDQWPIWTTTTTIAEIVPTDDGGSFTRTRDVPEKITIANLGFAIFAFGITVVAIRDLPGLLDFAALRRMPLDRSTRYAITTITTYLIAMVGLVVCCQCIGLHWNQIQWMATALTFGLAFGLQEMFANFIAGIIILFEQPVRVGDVVEIDGVTGSVTRIRIRATTISSWDRKDYIVPNKEFITGKLLNWTRSDDICRIVVEVGIAYGSDTDLARRLLLKAANDHPEVLAEPPSIASFEQFGDNSLNYKLRAFIKSYEKRFYVTHDLHTAIDQAFRKAEIEISFPQRDLHLRTVPEPMRRLMTERQTTKNT
jgi:potassium efflux system protein